MDKPILSYFYCMYKRLCKLATENKEIIKIAIMITFPVDLD